LKSDGLNKLGFLAIYISPDRGAVRKLGL